MPIVVVIATGSRHFKDHQAVERGLDRACRFACGLWAREAEAVLVVGDASGLDDLARRKALALGWRVDVFAADWRASGRAAGPLRNQQMVNSASDLSQRHLCHVVCAAFPMDDSVGTWDCIRRATRARIPTLIFPAV